MQCTTPPASHPLLHRPPGPYRLRTGAAGPNPPRPPQQQSVHPPQHRHRLPLPLLLPQHHLAPFRRVHPNPVLQTLPPSAVPAAPCTLLCEHPLNASSGTACCSSTFPRTCSTPTTHRVHRRPRTGTRPTQQAPSQHPQVVEEVWEQTSGGGKGKGLDARRTGVKPAPPRVSQQQTQWSLHAPSSRWCSCNRRATVVGRR
jgi:hypothetical protein